jgi:hypothetical protein
MTDEEKIELIDNQLEEIEEQLQILLNLKRSLRKEREKLVEKKNLQKSQEKSNNEWDRGKYSKIIKHSQQKLIDSPLRHIFVVEDSARKAEEYIWTRQFPPETD